VKVVRLSPFKHSGASDIAECIIPKNDLKDGFNGSFVQVVLEDNEYANKDGRFFDGEKKALAVRCSGCQIGYIPELYSVTEWKGADDAWTLAVEAVRDQLSLDYTRNGISLWSGNVYACRYISNVGGLTRYKTYLELQELDDAHKSKFNLEQVSICLENVE